MSLVVAAAVGLAAGGAASAFIFNYTKSEYEQKINELEALVNTLQDHLSAMKGLREQVYQFWEDDNARSVCGELDRTILETEREMGTVKAFIDSLRTAVSELDTSNSLMQDTIDDLKSLLTAGISG